MPSDTFEITAHPQYAVKAREHVRGVAAAAGLAPDELDDLEIAVGEAVTNAILYGSPSAASRIVISSYYQHDTQEFHTQIRDQGHGFDPGQVRSDGSTDMLGGRGIHLMRALMDAATLEYTGTGMIVHLIKKHAA